MAIYSGFSHLVYQRVVIAPLKAWPHLTDALVRRRSAQLRWHCWSCLDRLIGFKKHLRRSGSGWFLKIVRRLLLHVAGDQWVILVRGKLWNCETVHIQLPGAVDRDGMDGLRSTRSEMNDARSSCWTTQLWGCFPDLLKQGLVFLFSPRWISSTSGDQDFWWAMVASGSNLRYVESLWHQSELGTSQTCKLQMI